MYTYQKSNWPNFYWEIEKVYKILVSVRHKQGRLIGRMEGMGFHLQFVTIHPFDDGNGRIARALADMQLARADQSVQRFYSMSSQIRKERKKYYTILEKIQKGDLDITNWIIWFLECIERAIDNSEENLSSVLSKWKFWDRHSSSILNERQRKMINKLFSDYEGKLISSKWAKMNKCSQDTAGRDINDLMDKGILLKEAGGGRSTCYTMIV